MRLPLLLALISVAFAQTNQPRVQLVTSDVENFWKAYDASQAGNREEAFQRLYLDPGSPGLKDFVKLRIQSAKALADAIDQTYPKFYASVRPYTFKVEEQRGAILKHLDRFRELYPEAEFPPVYFVIGRLTSGGTTSDRGLLIGTEVNSLGPDVNTSEINPTFRRAMGSADHIPLIVVHELTHTQKKRADHGKLPHLLDQSIEEGAADFMTELVAGSSINAYAKEWAEARHDELFQRFAADLNAKPNDTSQWLYNYSRANDQPADLGYWIGAEICHSYYANAKDKREAIRNIVTLVNTESIVRNSRYASLLESH
jgi:Predicted Zn-dependent protease (DUF2268)